MEEVFLVNHTLADFIYFAPNTDNAVNQAVNTGILILTALALSMSLLTAFSFGLNR